ncbi:MAG: hypothetical protein HFF17_15500 [Oscillospiraceae bacterium]|nr:hypothetical protein [Oscillospiraceae bacterium]
MNNEEKILAMLDKLTSDMAEMKTTQAAQGERLLNIEMRIENTIIPDIKALAGGHMQLLETLASKESVEELKDSMVEWETANKASLSEMWRRIASLERAN